MQLRAFLVVILRLVLRQLALAQAACFPVRFEHISIDQGLSSLEVWSIQRDNQVFIWFGTLDGLNRYDGYQTKVFRHDHNDPGSETFTHYQHDSNEPASLSDNPIRALHQDNKGFLWVGTFTGGLDRLDLRSVPANAAGAVEGSSTPSPSFLHFRNDPQDPRSLSDNSIFSILHDASGADPSRREAVPAA